jgi:hypothetical protein
MQEPKNTPLGHAWPNAAAALTRGDGIVVFALEPLSKSADATGLPDGLPARRLEPHAGVRSARRSSRHQSIPEPIEDPDSTGEIGPWMPISHSFLLTLTSSSITDAVSDIFPVFVARAI